MYYVIESSYIGPDWDTDRYIDADTIEIHTSPPETISGEECIRGWCDTADNWNMHAHGAYATIEEAREKIAKKFGEVRDCDVYGDTFKSDDEDVIEIYKPGPYIPLSSDTTGGFFYKAIEADITADTSDERIEELIAQYEAEANSALRSTLSEDRLRELMQKRRQELLDDKDDEEE